VQYRAKQARGQQRPDRGPAGPAPALRPPWGPVHRQRNGSIWPWPVEADGVHLGQGDLPPGHRPAPARPRTPDRAQHQTAWSQLPGPPWPTAAITSGWGRCIATAHPRAGDVSRGGWAYVRPGRRRPGSRFPSFRSAASGTASKPGKKVVGCRRQARLAVVAGGDGGQEDSWRGPCRQLLGDPQVRQGS